MVRQEAVAQMEVKAAGPGEDESLAEGQFTGCLLYTSPSPRDS